MLSKSAPVKTVGIIYNISQQMYILGCTLSQLLLFVERNHTENVLDVLVKTKQMKTVCG